MPLPPEFHDLAARVNNWGRWGADDEVGTLNWLTPDVVRAAVAEVRTGRRLSLALPLSLDGVQTGWVRGRVNPVHTMVSVNSPLLGDPTMFCSSDDVVFMALQAGTHWDALAHVSYDGRLYNGRPADTIGVHGASFGGIDKVGSVVGRGVLLDVARARGVDVLPGGDAVGPDDLDAAVELGRLDVRRGDLVLVRTGQVRRFHEGGAQGYAQPGAGVGMQAVQWFHRHEVAAVATDNYTFEVVPPEQPDCWLPVHLLHLVEMGLTQGQNWDLERLSEDCADDGVYSFLLEASPQPFVGAVGSPVNPVAVR